MFGANLRQSTCIAKRILGILVKIPRKEDGIEKIISVALLVATLVLVQSCAVIRAPDGGPADTTGPAVAAFSPAQGTVMFSGNSVTIRFSEYVNKSNVTQNLFISPPADVELDWSGREVEINFTEPLAPNTSYAVTLGTEFTDLHNNKPVESFTLIFSTGAIIDSGVVQGNMLSPQPEGTFLFLYPLTGINPDTLNPSHTKPKYRTQVGTNGQFRFAALADGAYRLIAVRDEFKNGLYDAGTDGVGTPWLDIVVTSGASAAVSLLCGRPIDTLGPLLYDVRPIHSRLIEVSFGEDIDTFSVRSAAFSVTDSASGAVVPVQAAYPGKNAKTINILLGEEAIPTRKIRVHALADSTVALRDVMKNPLQDTLNVRYITPSQRKDTAAVQLLGTTMRDSTKGIELSPVFDIKFSAPIDTETVALGSSLTDLSSNKALAIDVQSIMSSMMRMHPAEKLESNHWYELQVRLSGVRGWNGVRIHDTTLTLRFQTVDLRLTGKVKGILKDSIFQSNRYSGYTVILISEDRKRRYSQEIAAPGNFEFADIPEGTYKLEAFARESASGKVAADGYFYGAAFPYRRAWRFRQETTPVSVRQRWTVEGVIIDFGR